jgi:hypothetical protein
VPEKIAQHYNVCTDTDKRGLYFATYPFLSMAIATEYQRDMFLGVFELTQDIEAADGKYKFRELMFPKGVRSGEDLKSIPSPLPEKYNINHIDTLILPILQEEGDDKDILPSDFTATGWAGELFIAKSTDRAKLKLIDAFIIRYAEVPRIARELEYNVHADYYMESAIEWLKYLKPTSVLDKVPTMNTLNSQNNLQALQIADATETSEDKDLRGGRKTLQSIRRKRSKHKEIRSNPKK